MLTETLLAIIGTCEIGHARIVGDVSLRLGEFVHLGSKVKWTGRTKKRGLLVGDAMFKVASAACAPSSSMMIKKIINEKQQLTHARMTPSPATTGHSLSAVEYVLDGQIDIVANAAPCNFDPIRQGRQGTLRE